MQYDGKWKVYVQIQKFGHSFKLKNSNAKIVVIYACFRVIFYHMENRLV